MNMRFPIIWQQFPPLDFTELMNVLPMTGGDPEFSMPGSSIDTLESKVLISGPNYKVTWRKLRQCRYTANHPNRPESSERIFEEIELIDESGTITRYAANEFKISNSEPCFK